MPSTGEPSSDARSDEWATPPEWVAPSAVAGSLRESRDWWKAEWEHKNREADVLWLTLLGMAVLVGLAFFVGTVVG